MLDRKGTFKIQNNINNMQ